MVSASSCLMGNMEQRHKVMKTKDNNSSTAKLLTLYAQIWLYQLIGIAIFVIGRMTFLFTHGGDSLFDQHIDCLPLFAWNAWRFDIQSITYITLPPLLVTFVVAFLKSDKSYTRCRKFIRSYYAILLAITALLVVAEFYFYSNFNTRYNVVFFDFFDEGPLGLLRTMWEDYPFMGILAFIVAIGSATFFAGRFIARKSVKQRKWMGTKATILSILLIAALTFVFMRGSVTTYTLQVEAFIVSPDDNVNEAVPNSLYMLKKAYKERSESFKLKSDIKVLKENGFASFEEAVTAAALPGSNGKESLEDILFSTVERGDSVTHPNILLIMNESWSRYLVEFDKEEKLDLLCSLRPHLKEDILLKNFQSVRNGTVYSLESVILAMPYLHYFQSRYRYDSLATSIAYPFKESGYSTRFITGMDPTWENLNEALKVQYFDRIDGRIQVMQDIKGSTTSQIGVYDEFLYKYIAQELENESSSGKPQFVMALTTTNHPPFTYPENMNLPPLTDEWYCSPSITGSDDVKTKYGLGAQYANRCLGDFLTWFKNSRLASNTIVIVTGDHNVRSILNYDVVADEYRHSVPLYIYLPPQYSISDTAKRIVEDRFGCHYDILPTIAGLAFGNNVSYLNIGNNLLDTLKSNDSYFSYNEKQTLAPNSSHNDSIRRMVEARQTLMRLYYQNIFKN